MAGRSYFYVFIRDDMTALDQGLKEAFPKLGKLMAGEIEVNVYSPKDSGFRNGLEAFGIVQWPGFALTDQPYELSAPSSPNPYITLNRPVLETLGEDDILNLVQDLHEMQRREGILRMKRKDAEQRLAGVLNVSLDVLARVAAVVTTFVR